MSKPTLYPDCRVCGGDGYLSDRPGDCPYCRGTGVENGRFDGSVIITEKQRMIR